MMIITVKYFFVVWKLSIRFQGTSILKSNKVTSIYLKKMFILTAKKGVNKKGD